MNPKVSIVMPVFNGSAYLKSAIDSALGQTYENIEIIVVNDGSSDEGQTEKIALSYGDKIRYFCKPNGGVSSAMNLGIEVMKGEYFSWLSHDDLYFPNKIQRQIETLQSLNDFDCVIYSDYEFINDHSQRLLVQRLTEIEFSAFRSYISTTNRINGCSLLIPKKCFDKCGVFNESLYTCQDYDLWFRIGKYFKFVHLPEILISSRKHFAQTTYGLQERMRQECDVLFLGFMNELSDEEIVSYCKLPSSLSFAKMAAIFALKGLSKPLRYLAKKSLSHWDVCSPVAFLLVLFSIVLFPILLVIRRIQIQLIPILRSLKRDVV